jgi:hypothetical protein
VIKNYWKNFYTPKNAGIKRPRSRRNSTRDLRAEVKIQRFGHIPHEIVHNLVAGRPNSYVFNCAFYQDGPGWAPDPRL